MRNRMTVSCFIDRVQKECEKFPAAKEDLTPDRVPNPLFYYVIFHRSRGIYEFTLLRFPLMSVCTGTAYRSFSDFSTHIARLLMPRTVPDDK